MMRETVEREREGDKEKSGVEESKEASSKKTIEPNCILFFGYLSCGGVGLTTSTGKSSGLVFTK